MHFSKTTSERHSKRWGITAFKAKELFGSWNSPAFVETQKRPNYYLAQISSYLGLFTVLPWFLFVKGKWPRAFVALVDFPCFGKSHNRPFLKLIYAERKSTQLYPPRGVGNFEDRKFYLGPHKRYMSLVSEYVKNSKPPKWGLGLYGSRRILC